jgi:phospholipase C
LHKVNHIIIVMQENHSFDNYFGVLPYAPGSPYHVSRTCAATGRIQGAGPRTAVTAMPDAKSELHLMLVAKQTHEHDLQRGEECCAMGNCHRIRLRAC